MDSQKERVTGSVGRIVTNSWKGGEKCAPIFTHFIFITSAQIGKQHLIKKCSNRQRNLKFCTITHNFCVYNEICFNRKNNYEKRALINTTQITANFPINKNYFIFYLVKFILTQLGHIEYEGWKLTTENLETRLGGTGSAFASRTKWVSKRGNATYNKVKKFWMSVTGTVSIPGFFFFTDKTIW